MATSIDKALAEMSALKRAQREEQRQKIIKLYADGLPIPNIAERFALGVGAVRGLLGLDAKKKHRQKLKRRAARKKRASPRSWGLDGSI